MQDADAAAGAPVGAPTPELAARVVDERSAFPPIRRLGMFRAFSWLAAGARDFRAAPVMSLFFGLCFCAMGWLVRLALQNAPQYLSAMTTGFLLVGPLLSLGLYDLSRRIERGKPALWASLCAIRGRWSNVGTLAVVMGVVLLVWARASLVVFAMFYNKGMPTMEHFLSFLFSLENIDFIVVYACVGFIFASLVFALSWISIPMMLDRDTDAISSIIVSITALFINAPATMVWALCIVALVVFGFLTWNIGLIVAMPIVGHATWHAYRDVVAWRDEQPAAQNL